MCLAITYRIKDGIKNVGIAYVDSVDRRLGVTEFVENDIFSNTEVRKRIFSLPLMLDISD